MVPIAELWLPILLSVIAVFVASNICWMALPIHKNDYRRLGQNESGLIEFIRSRGIAPGVYMFPGCDPASLKDNPAAQERMKTGPWGTVTILPAGWNMGKCLGLWILNLVIISTVVGYVAGLALPRTAETMRIVQVVATVCMLAYGGSALTDSIWKGRPWSHLPGAIFDAVAYSAATTAVFVWQWPGAETLAIPAP